MRKILFCTFALIMVFSISSVNQAEAAKADAKMAVSGGLGTTFPMGDMGDAFNFPMIPLLLSFQYAVVPFVTIEADIDYYLYTNPEYDEFDYTIYQYGVSGRYWLSTKWKQGKAYKGIYFGGGLARTHTEVEYEYNYFNAGTMSWETRTAKGDDDVTTLVMKGGYILPLNPVLLDFGARYDAVDLKFGDALFTAYAMVSYLF